MAWILNTNQMNLSRARQGKGPKYGETLIFSVASYPPHALECGVLADRVWRNAEPICNPHKTPWVSPDPRFLTRNPLHHVPSREQGNGSTFIFCPLYLGWYKLCCNSNFWAFPIFFFCLGSQGFLTSPRGPVVSIVFPNRLGQGEFLLNPLCQPIFTFHAYPSTQRIFSTRKCRPELGDTVHSRSRASHQPIFTLHAHPSAQRSFSNPKCRPEHGDTVHSSSCANDQPIFTLQVHPRAQPILPIPKCRPDLGDADDGGSYTNHLHVQFLFLGN